MVDPVLGATSGGSFSAETSAEELAQEIIKTLLPQCTLVTPNLIEAEQLTGLTIQSSKDAENAAAALVDLGAKNVLIKGGHASNPDYSQDFFLGQDRSFWLNSRRIDTQRSRGTGCALSSAIATALAFDHRICLLYTSPSPRDS